MAAYTRPTKVQARVPALRGRNRYGLPPLTQKLSVTVFKGKIRFFSNRVSLGILITLQGRPHGKE